LKLCGKSQGLTRLKYTLWLTALQITTRQMRRNKASGLRCVQYGRHCTGYEAFLVAVNEAESKSKHVVLQNSTLKFLIPLLQPSPQILL
jgi:hypothetical protein